MDFPYKFLLHGTCFLLFALMREKLTDKITLDNFLAISVPKLHFSIKSNS